MSQGIKELKLAVLIDADNVLYSNASGWKSVLLNTPLLQFNNTVILWARTLLILQ